MQQSAWSGLTVLRLDNNSALNVCLFNRNKYHWHWAKSVRIRSYSGPYSVRMQENTDQKNSEYRHFSRSDCCNLFPFFFPYLQTLAIDKIAQDFVNRFQKKLLFKGFLHGNNSERFHKFPMKTRLEEQLCIYDPVKHLWGSSLRK